jgi:hypothetical protein
VRQIEAERTARLKAERQAQALRLINGRLKRAVAALLPADGAGA